MKTPLKTLAAGLILSWGCTSAQTITDCKKLLAHGQYSDCLDAATIAVDRRSYGEDWPLLKAEAEYHLGRYPDAEKTLEAGSQRYAWSIRLRMKAYVLAKMSGDGERAQGLLDVVGQLATDSPWRYTDADDLVALGQASIELGADPKDVLEGFYNRARRNYRSRVDGFLAAAQLAVDKGDRQLAVDILTPVLERFEENADVLFVMSQAIGSSNPERAAELAQQALKVNPRYAPALLQQVSRQIDAESYSNAEAILDRILQTNPWHPEAHAYSAVIHHLRNRPQKEARSRSDGMVYSGANPDVDHLIGKTLSRRYRFFEGARYQRLALKNDPLHLPARTQLAQDLLRLGLDDEGWDLADAAQRQDKYNTTLYNLMQLRESLDGFATIRNERFVIRMDRVESHVYGARVESLLDRAFETLTEKYGYVPDEPVIVEIFDRPDDFAVRTFGIPDVAGFLGVCFGKLITANSPASQRDNPNNWESVLWHEFCHVITLQMTGNRIPRWLSEGISVYEERLQDPRWGQRMSPSFRDRILSGNITPVSELSSAFLNAGDGQDLNFAYYESSMVVDFLVREHGFDALNAILADLNAGLNINDALDRHTGGLETLDSSFEADLKRQAADYAKGVVFQSGRMQSIATDVLQTGGSNYPAGLRAAAEEIEQEDFGGAEARLLKLIELYPQDVSHNSARKILAGLYRTNGQSDRQAEVLAEHIQRSDDDLDAAMQLMKLQIDKQQWEAATATGQLVMAIDPIQPQALRNMLEVSQATDAREESIQLLMGLLHIEPANAARWHFQLAEAYEHHDVSASRRHVLLALERAPRYREAHRLLLRVTSEQVDETE